jgi:hypothetical protein
MLASLPQAKELLGDTGYDSNHFRQALTLRGIEPCIPSSRARKLQVPTTERSIGSDTAL